jgi:amino acid adenylation domain-containing protein
LCRGGLGGLGGMAPDATPSGTGRDMTGDPTGLVERLEAAGIQLWFEGRQLRFRAPRGALSTPLRDELTARRDAVLTALRAREAARVTLAPLSYGQRSLWLVHQERPDSAAYNVAFAVSVRSAIDTTQLREALQILSDRHAVLRTTYRLVDNRPQQHIPGSSLVELALHDCRDDDDAALRERVQADYRRPIDLQSGPVWRSALFSRAPDDQVLLICAHHIAVDGWSLLLLLDELRQLLAGLASGQAPALPRPENGYVDYVAWQARMLASEEGESLAKYWQTSLRAPRAELELPCDRTRPPRKSGRGATREFMVPTPLLCELQQLARAEGTTLYVLMLAAFKVLLMRHSGTEDVVVGTPTLGRDKGRFDRCVGHFVNPVPLRTQVDASLPFRALLGRVRDTLLAAVEAQEYPLALMVEGLRPERIAGRSPLFETMFVLQRFEQFGTLARLLNAAPQAVLADFGGLAVRPYPFDQQEGQFDLGLGLVELDEGLAGAFKYADELFEATTIERLTAAYLQLLQGVVADTGMPVGRLPLLDAEQRVALLPPPRLVSGGPGRTLHARFEAQAARRPDAVALTCGDTSMSYGELDRRANRVAHALRAEGAAPGQLVGLCVEREPDLVVGLLGILKSGAAYVPLDPSHPDDRIAYTLEDCAARLLVTQAPLRARLASFKGTTLCVDEVQGLGLSNDLLPPAAGPDDPIYVIYTSGSTGQPKGTVLTHRAVDRLLDATHPWYGFNDTDVWTLFHSAAFDFSVWELWGALAYGGRLVVVPYAVSRMPDDMLELLRREGVTVLNQTPSAFRQLVQADIVGAPHPFALRYVIFGGEALELQSLRPWFERHGDSQPRLVNMYGITETCVHVTYRPIRLADVDAGRGSLIGEPIPDLCLQVLEPSGEPAPIGVVGEIHVGGPGLALGYLNRPELTAERFIDDPSRPGERLYRSGDLARRLADGELEYIGRRDQQVKIRGFRIELGEIEAALGRQPGVRQAVAVTHPPGRNPTQIVAYVVATDMDANRLRNALRAALPEYMVPSVFMFLETLPLTVNNKVDLRALPAPQAALEPAHAGQGPTTAREAELLALWRAVLAQPALGTTDNFFDRGGHSLLAVELLSRVQQSTGRKLPFVTLFESPTVRQMAALFEGESQGSTATTCESDATTPASHDDLVPALLSRLEQIGVKLIVEGDKLRVNAPKGAINDDLRARIGAHKAAIVAALSAPPAGPPPARNALLPLSHMQQRLWFLKQLDPGNAAYNVPCPIRFEGDLDEGLVERAMQALVVRHESLRTRFVTIDGVPHCRVEPHAVLPIERADLSALQGEAQQAEMVRRLKDFAARPFDIGRAPLLRAIWLRLAPRSRVFCFVIDHIISDGHSLGVLMQELQALYQAGLEGRADALPALPMQYADLVAWQQDVFTQGALAEHQLFWTTRLAGLPALLPLPTDRPRPPVQTYHGARISRVLAPQLLPRVRAVARSAGATPFMVLLAAFQLLLQRHAGVDDIAVGTAVANRTHPRAAGVVGFFANNVVLRSDLSGRPTVSELLARVRETCLQAMTHQEMPFDLLVDALVTRRETDHAPLFQVLFVLQNWATPRFELPGASGEIFTFDGGMARYDLSVDLFEADDRLFAYFEYNTELFDAGTIERLMSQYEQLLDDLLARPQAHIDELRLLPPGEQAQLVHQWNATAVDYPRGQTVHGLFEAQAARTPEATALRSEQVRLDYRTLNARANQVAHHLRTLGVGRESLVGVWMERSADMVVAMLGVMKAGGAYVPLDPAFPKDRIDYMMADAEVAVVLTQSHLAATLGAGGPRAVCMDGDGAALAVQSEADPAPLSDAGNLAYVIYTSGSTGRPKGVMLEHRSVVNFLLSMHREPGITSADRFVSVTTLSFDIAGLEIHGPLTIGGTVVLASRATALDGVRLAALLESSDATLLQATPATWRLLLDSGWTGSQGLKMLCGGEGLPRDLADRLLATGGELWNMYGPTETTIWSTVWRVTDTRRAIPIGRPIANTQVYVLEPSGQPAPIGVAGELCIGGDGLARGYRGRDDLTAENFVAIGVPGGGTQRVYRTGDLVRFLADGRLEFVGRRDHQVKVRGFRIELGEIETVLATHPGLKDSVVHVREDTPGDQRLVGYVVPAGDWPFETDAARTTLRAKLPEYMIPNQFVVLDALPLTPNGKVDRKALPAPAQPTASADDTQSEALMTPQQRQVAALWREVLRIDRIGLHANFFDIGGHSLLLVKLQAGLKREFGRDLPLVELFQRTTVAAQADCFAAVVAQDGALERARARAARQVHG